MGEFRGKIDRIKAVRDKYGCSLMTAKGLVDREMDSELVSEEEVKILCKIEEFRDAVYHLRKAQKLSESASLDPDTSISDMIQNFEGAEKYLESLRGTDAKKRAVLVG